MNTYSILIADDEPEARKLIRFYLQHASYNIITQEAGNGLETLYALQTLKPHIVFLDIKMPELTGIDVLNSISLDYLPGIIFTTAYDEYALPAFDFEAVDYLLKPFEEERFRRALKRAIDFVNFHSHQSNEKRIEAIPVKKGTETILVPVEEIVYMQAEGTYVKLFTENKSYLIADPLYQLEAKLSSDLFIRVHRSVIVNVGHIKSITALPNADHILLLKNDITVRASRTFRENIKKLTAHLK